MSDILIGVIIGGIIGSIVPFSTLVFGHLRWKREAKLEYLKSERIRIEKLFDENLGRLAEAIAKNNYSADLISDIMVLMPNDVSNTFDAFIKAKQKSIEDRRSAYLEISLAMKNVLAKADKEIRDLLS